MKTGPTPEIPQRQIRAIFDQETITVYQAYSDAIADAAISAGRFGPPFSLSRMTWIKPSFMWMMYRSAWATKPGQERVLAIRISRIGFEWALAHSCLASFDPHVYGNQAEWLERKRVSPIRVQWDPERAWDLTPLPWRSIQVGLSGEAIHSYVNTWTVQIDDITPLVKCARPSRANIGKHELDTILSHEKPYPLTGSLRTTIGAS